MVVIHSFFTDGLFNWGKLFLQSFKKYNGESFPIILSTRNLSNFQIEELKDSYKNLSIYNQNLNWKELSRLSGVNVKPLKKYKKQVEHSDTNKNNFRWKILMSVEERYRKSILEDGYNQCSNGQILLHFDIDMYFRSSIDNLIRHATKHDVSLMFRIKDKPDQKDSRKIQGSLLSIKKNNKGSKFLTTFIKHIDSINTSSKPRGYGQTALYRAYLDTRNYTNFGDIKKIENFKIVSNPGNKKANIWSGIAAKADNALKECLKDHE